MSHGLPVKTSTRCESWPPNQPIAARLRCWRSCTRSGTCSRSSSSLFLAESRRSNSCFNLSLQTSDRVPQAIALDRSDALEPESNQPTPPVACLDARLVSCLDRWAFLECGSYRTVVGDLVVEDRTAI